MDVPIDPMQKSQASNKSKSLKSKYVAKKVEIDEALFGTLLVTQASGPRSRSAARRSCGG